MQIAWHELGRGVVQCSRGWETLSASWRPFMTAATKGSVAAAKSFLARFLAPSSSSRISGRMPLARLARTKLSPDGVRVTSSFGTSCSLRWQPHDCCRINLYAHLLCLLEFHTSLTATQHRSKQEASSTLQQHMADGMCREYVCKVQQARGKSQGGMQGVGNAILAVQPDGIQAALG